MSQAGIVSSSSSPPPPAVPTDFVTDSGTAIPALNILNVNGGDTNVDNDNGIRVIANLTGSNNMVVQLTNRITGTVTTTDATPTTLVSLSMGSTAGVYTVWGHLVAYDVTDAAGASYGYEGAAITDGAVGTEIGSEVRNLFEQAALATSDFAFAVSGNNAEIVVTGIVGKVINWSGLFNYRFQG